MRATGLTVLEAHRDREAALGALQREGRLAVEQDEAEVLCLGCGGLLGLRESLEARLGVPVVEAVPAAAALLHGLIVNGLAHVQGPRVQVSGARRGRDRMTACGAP